MTTPASIRYKNPGAMWGKGNAIATKWGADPKNTVGLNDGLGQGNNIAVFPTYIDGACAQLDLWRSHYSNMTLKAAILKWSGGNWSQPYANFLTEHTGLSMDTIITTTILSGPSGWKLIKYQAQWEAGQPYPMTDDDWQTAQKRVFSGASPTAPSSVHPTAPVTPAKPVSSTPSITNPAKGSIGAAIAALFAAIFKRKA